MDIGALSGILQQALSHEERVRKPAEALLQSWEPHPGYCSCLLEIILNRGIDSNARWLAAVMLKNTVQRHWQKRISGGITDEEKNHIRVRLFQTFEEDNDRIAVQVALVFAKIARVDYPQYWDNLLPSLLEKIQSASPVQSNRALLTLHHVLKELATKRLTADQRRFQQLAPQLFQYFVNQWFARMDALLSALAGVISSPTSSSNFDYGTVAPVASVVHLYLKIIRLLMVEGITRYSEHPEVASFFSNLPARLARLTEFGQALQSSPSTDKLGGVLDKTIVLLGRTAVECYKAQSVHFTFFLLPLVHYFYGLVVDSPPANIGSIPEGLRFHAFTFVKNVLYFQAHRRKGGPPRFLADGPNQAHPTSIKSATPTPPDDVDLFFSPGKISELCKLIVSKYFIVPLEEMEDWDLEPETFVHNQDPADTNETLRGYAERLFLVLAEVKREVVGPVVVEMMGQVATPVSYLTFDGWTLLKDACYLAVGLAADSLHDYIDFPSWFAAQLRPELQQTAPEYRVVRRRAAWVIGCWVRRISEEMRPYLYESLLSLLQTKDIVSQLTVVETFTRLIDDCQFLPDAFNQFADPCARLLVELLGSLSLSETKLHVVTLLALLIERMGVAVRASIPLVIESLKSLWESRCDGQNLIKTAVVRTLAKVVQALGPHATDVFSFVLPIVKHATDVNQPDELYLLEDGLQLWLSAVGSSPSFTPEILALFVNVPPLLRRDYEHLKECMVLLESYIILGQNQFMQAYASEIVSLMLDMIGNLKDRGSKFVAAVMETIIVQFPNDGSRLLEPVLSKMLSVMFTNQETDVVVASFICVYARIALHNPTHFRTLMSTVNHSTNQALMGPFLDLWFDKVDSLGSAPRRKLTALALAALIPSTESIILERIGQIINVCVDVLHDPDIKTLDPKEGLLWNEGISAEPDEDGVIPQDAMTGDSARRAQLRWSDPVFVLELRSFLVEKIKELRQVVGQAVFSQVVASIDPTIRQQLTEYVDLHSALAIS